MVRSSSSTPSLVSRLCDVLTIGGICLLLLGTPLAFGSVHLWAFSLMEGIVFFLVALWMEKLLVMRWQSNPLVQASQSARIATRPLFLPLALFIGVIGLQLIPLPPELLSHLSPATFTLYRQSLPGWPEQSPYQEWLKQEDEGGADKATLTTVNASQTATPAVGETADVIPVGEWMPLSMAPAVSRVALLQILSYVGFFLLLLLYPLGTENTKEAERRFVRTIFVTILSSGLLIAAIGVMQRFLWNGKILWFFIPEQWESALPDITPRASGPFVNSDHFANYLALVFPLLLGSLNSQKLFVSDRKDRAFKIFCGFGLFAVFLGLLLSLSRGGWIAAGLGTGSFLWFLRKVPDKLKQQSPARFGLSRFRLGVFGGGVVFLLTLVFVGSSGRSQIDQRIEETLTFNSGLNDRLLVWEDSLGMIRNFPLLGVGLGAWAELFPRYQHPPWDPLPWEETHNDYLQCLAETGVVGFCLLIWFFGGVVLQLWRGLSSAPAPNASLVAGILAAIGAMAFHEGFDFSLHIPANALLCIALIAVGLRMVGNRGSDLGEPHHSRWQTPLAVSVGTVACILSLIAISQEKIVRYNDPDDFTSVAEARENILAFPARSDGHVALVSLLEDSVPLTERMKELEAALWLRPLNPEVRDQYVVALLEQGQQEAALKEVQQSVFNSPTLDTHFYLTPEAISSLDPPEIQAIEGGLLNAWAVGYPGALTGLGDFYEQTNRPLEKARVYETAALSEQREKWKTRYWLEAGKAYVLAGENMKAESPLRQAIQLTPQDARAYLMLIADVFSVSGDIAAAQAVATEGIARGIDPPTLLLAVAGTAQRTGKREEVQAILQELIKRQPSSFDARYRSGVLYLQEKNFPRATLTLKEAVRLQPNSAEAFFMLGQAEEAQYHYSDAQKAYAQALHFATDNSGYRQRYDALLKKLQSNEGAARGAITTRSATPDRLRPSPPKF